MRNKNKSYTEQHRNQFHFSPPSHWMNDPNGMVYLEGEYHLFYQYHPESTKWGPMHWGHAVSNDLIHWEHLPIALYPDEHGYIFSGGAVIDRDNTAGFGKNALIAIYTSHNAQLEQIKGHNSYETQSIAYSLDKGRTFTKYGQNPVIQNPGIKDFRDPKVFWHNQTMQWILILAAADHMKLYSSPDLKAWTHLSDFGHDIGAHDGVWECPDLFPLKIKDTEEIKWVLLASINPGGPGGGSATQYFIGDFDGREFHLDKEFSNTIGNNNAQWIDYGRDNYAGVTWTNVPDHDGRRLFIGWMSNWNYAEEVPATTWRSNMTVVRELRIRRTNEGLRLFSTAIAEYERLAKNNMSIQVPQSNEPKTLSVIKNVKFVGKIIIQAHKASSNNGKLYIKLSNDLGEAYIIGYNFNDQKFYSDRSNTDNEDIPKSFAKSMLKSTKCDCTKIKMELFVDKSSVELFAQDGEIVITEIFYPTVDYNHIDLVIEDGEIQLDQIDFTEYKSIWNN